MSLPHKDQKGFAAVEGTIIIVIVGLLGTSGWFVWHRESSKHTNQLHQAAVPKQQSLPSAKSLQNSDASQVATINGVRVKHNSYYNLAIGSSRYYGQVSKINQDYIRLSPVFYDKGSTLVQLGDELHAPEPAMYIKVAGLKSISELSTSDSHYQAIQNFLKANATPSVQDTYPSANITKYVKSSDYQALFFTDGKTFFGRIGSLTGGSLFADTAQVFTLRSNGTQTSSLVKVSPAELSNYGIAQLEFWENLKPSGRISVAIINFLKSNPS